MFVAVISFGGVNSFQILSSTWKIYFQHLQNFLESMVFMQRKSSECQTLFNITTFHRSGCSKPGKWGVMYMCLSVSISPLFLRFVDSRFVRFVFYSIAIFFLKSDNYIISHNETKLDKQFVIQYKHCLGIYWVW